MHRRFANGAASSSGCELKACIRVHARFNVSLRLELSAYICVNLRLDLLALSSRSFAVVSRLDRQRTETVVLTSTLPRIALE